MIAKKVVTKLAALGVDAVKFTEANDEVDGEVEINERVSVRIPLHGRMLTVVHQRRDKFVFYPSRGNLENILPDIKAALAIDAADQCWPTPLHPRPLSASI